MNNINLDEFDIKPQFNLKWYKNEDLYSEGDIEDKILDIIASNPPEEYSDAIYDNFSWSTYYHLSGVRKNILNWYPFKEDSSVLEIGCGLGAITNMLCDRCKSVTAVELSKRRGTGALLRCRERENLEVIIGNLNDIEFEEKFDYITLIGVLEYQGSYTGGVNPYRDFLVKIRQLLKPDGVLLIAIENQYGLKYWCGANEDHTGHPFDGINQYESTDRSVRTFSKEALNRLITEAGLENTNFYYPMPDYKLPVTIYSDRHLPTAEELKGIRPYYYPFDTKTIANEKAIYSDIADNKVFGFFANSFLVECSQSERLCDVTYATMSSFRFHEYQIGTRFTADNMVEKFALCANGIAHIEETHNNLLNMADHGLAIWGEECEADIIRTDFSNLALVETVLVDAFNRKDEELIREMFALIYDDILKSSEQLEFEENILYTLGLNLEPSEDKYGPIISIGYLDMIPRNAFWDGERVVWFDQEWVLENVPARFVMYRALVRFYKDHPELEDIYPSGKLIDEYKLGSAWGEYQLLENLFSDAVIDNNEMAANMTISRK
ncbi:MAG: class I SAM-dependent methyltransferase [Lachnospiraceae bacterium]|nr:class I SAM-dependent methyltransferase [Candidatus Colinaster scatohippi]